MKTAFLFLLFAPPAVAALPAWIPQSNRIAEEYARADGALFPERASAAGLREFDARALHLEKDQNARELELLRAWRARLHSEEAQAGDENLRLDLRILRERLELRAREIELDDQYGVVSFLPGTRFVLESLLSLVNDQSGPERRAAALRRFHLYVAGEEQDPPLFTAFESRALADELRFQKKRLFPARAEVEQYLAESPAYVEGVRQALQKAAGAEHDAAGAGGARVANDAAGAGGWEADFAQFRAQAGAYDAFLRTHVLPLARKDFKLPKELYAHQLRLRGIDASPDELIRSARARYKTLYQEFRSTAREVAKEQGWSPRLAPARVIALLKRRQVLSAAEVKPLYEASARQLDEILRRENLVTLPAAPLRIRVAGDAESLANPVPHLNEPPLIGNTGERPEFVVPSFSGGAAALDDFSYQAAALVLTAHEGRPGHDLQFSSMLDQGTSVIRAHYAFNNANVEGWGLYAEEMVYPYLPRAARLAALQMRLLRVARAFLDPQVQLGKTRPRDVTRFLTHELGVSERLASLELRRFEVDNPGQAPSYFYGLEGVENARRRLSATLGARYSDRCFHDGVLSLGMVPVRMLGSELERSLRCGPGKATAERLPAVMPPVKALN